MTTTDKLTVTPENLLASIEGKREQSLNYPRARSISELTIAFIESQGRNPYKRPDGERTLTSNDEAQLRAMHVSPTAIRRALDALVGKGKVVALRGDEFAGTGLSGYGVRENATYYLLPEVLEAAKVQKASQEDEDLRNKLRDAAKQEILRQHALDVEHEYRRLLRENGLEA